MGTNSKLVGQIPFSHRIYKRKLPTNFDGIGDQKYFNNDEKIKDVKPFFNKQSAFIYFKENIKTGVFSANNSSKFSHNSGQVTAASSFSAAYISNGQNDVIKEKDHIGEALNSIKNIMNANGTRKINSNLERCIEYLCGNAKWIKREVTYSALRMLCYLWRQDIMRKEELGMYHVEKSFTNFKEWLLQHDFLTAIMENEKYVKRDFIAAQKEYIAEGKGSSVVKKNAQQQKVAANIKTFTEGSKPYLRELYLQKVIQLKIGNVNLVSNLLSWYDENDNTSFKKKYQAILRITILYDKIARNKDIIARLNLKNLGLNSLPRFLIHFPTLHILDLSGNNIPILCEEDFASLKMLTVCKLDLDILDEECFEKICSSNEGFSQVLAFRKMRNLEFVQEFERRRRQELHQLIKSILSNKEKNISPEKILAIKKIIYNSNSESIFAFNSVLNGIDENNYLEYRVHLEQLNNLLASISGKRRDGAPNLCCE